MDKTIIKGLSHNLALIISTLIIEIVSESPFLNEWLDIKSDLSLKSKIQKAAENMMCEPITT